MGGGAAAYRSGVANEDARCILVVEDDPLTSTLLPNQLSALRVMAA